MAEKNKTITTEQLKMLSLRAKADSAARIAALAALVADSYGKIITVTLPASKWSGGTQKIEHVALLANRGYCYSVCPDAECYGDWSDAGIKADNVIKDGEIMFRCEVAPNIDLNANILRLEVETI